MNLLRTDQLLLLEHLTYLPQVNGGRSQPLPSLQDFEGQHVADLMHGMDLSALEDTRDYGSFLTGVDWKNLIGAIEKDSDCMAMCIRETHIDMAEGGGSGFSVLLTHPSSGEAVVAFRGSATAEWRDNFIAGALVSSAQQENALAWYQSLALDSHPTITLIGHSKGGNKAKYTSLLDDSVSRCISFDGQGFSDEFLQQHASDIAARQHKIENHNLDCDYVSLLLNDIGTTTFYQGQALDKGGFLENHCPNRFFDFQAKGGYQMLVVDSRAAEMATLDDFLNQYLRTLSPKDKQQSLAVFGTVIEACFTGMEEGLSTAAVLNILTALSDEKNANIAAQFLAYTMRYIQSNPAFSAAAYDALARCGLQRLRVFFESFTGFMPPSSTVDTAFSLSSFLTEATAHPLPFLNALRSFLSGCLQLPLNQGQVRNIFSFLSKLHFYHHSLSLSDQGQERHLPSTARPCAFSVAPESLLQSAETLRQLSFSLRQTKTELQGVQMELSLFFWTQQRKLKNLSHQLEAVSDLCAHMDGTLSAVGGRYRKTEQGSCAGTSAVPMH